MSEHEVWNELGNLYFLSGEYDQAAYAYHRSIELDEGFGRPYSNLALTYVQQGKYQEAVDLYQRSLERLIDDKEKAISWNRLGNVHRHLKDYRKAVVAYQKADELDPQSASDFLEGTPRRVDSAKMPAVSSDVQISDELLPEVDAKTFAKESTEEQLPILDNPSTSWAQGAPTQYQQDLSISTDPGSLTSWGDGNFNGDEFEEFQPLEPDTDFYDPDSDENDLGNWLPIPEDELDSESETQDYVNEAEGNTLPTASRSVDAQPIGNLEMANVIDPDGRNANETSVSHSPLSREAASHEAYTPLLTAQSSASRLNEAGNLSDQLEDNQPKSETIASKDVDVEVVKHALKNFIVNSERHADAGKVLPIIEKGTSTSIEPSTMNDTGEKVESADVVHDDLEMKEIEAEITRYKRVVQINPRNALAWDALGTLYKSCENYKEAIAAYQQALSCDSSKAVYYHHLGLVYASEGRDEDAIAAFERVIEIDPDYSLAHATLGGYYRKMGLEELAQQHIGKAMKSIFDSENEYNRACMQAICGNADEAIHLLGVALKNKQTYVDWILRDPDLDFIRQDPRFKQLISDYTR